MRARRRAQLGWTEEKTKRAGTGVEWAAQEKDEAGREGRKVGRGRWAGRAGLGPTDAGPPPHVLTNALELQEAEHLGGVTNPPEYGTDAMKPRVPGKGRHPMPVLKVEKEDLDDEILWQQ